MNTQEVANRLVDMCRQGENLDAINQLYSDSVTSREMPGLPDAVVSGKQSVWNKNKAWLDNVETFHAGEISDPIVSGNHFTTKMTFDVTFKDRGRQQMEELCVFEVKDGKIQNEQFFYTM